MGAMQTQLPHQAKCIMPLDIAVRKINGKLCLIFDTRWINTLINSPCLVIFDPSKPTEVWADASGSHYTVGGVLLQDHRWGFQPVAYMSKVMNTAESHYATFEQELLALLKVMDKWRHYLLPIFFLARTDHHGL
eukprot:3923399-Rhodomonas_salina.1